MIARSCYLGGFRVGPPCNPAHQWNISPTKPVEVYLSSTHISLSFAELSPWIFCVHEELVTAPFPIVIIEPVWPSQPSYVAHDVSTHHLMIDISSTESVNSKPLVPFRYLSMRFGLPTHPHQARTLVMRNATAVWMSLRAYELINSSILTKWRNETACSSGSSHALSSVQANLKHMVSSRWYGNFSQIFLKFR